MKLLINKDIQLIPEWREDEYTVTLFKRCCVFVKDSDTVYAQKINLWDEGVFCDVVNSLQTYSTHRFDLSKCRMYVEGNLIFCWEG